jgi:hypothetical protein
VETKGTGKKKANDHPTHPTHPPHHGDAKEEAVSDERTDLERTEELFAFLQGTVPEGYHILDDNVPRLTPDQAWTVIWYLGNQYWQVTDHIERCGVCGCLFDTKSEGDCLDYGTGPYHFCDGCIYSEEYEKKKSQEGSEEP